MTREEAISEWTFRSNHIKKWLDEYGEEPSIRHYVELIDMAIEALQAEPSDLISRADALEQMAQAECGLHYDDCEADNCSCSYIQRILDMPSADAEPKMTEEVREALMRLTMCAREECDMCKYKDKCGFEFQYSISTENMNTILEALSADAVQGEWIPVSEMLPEDIKPVIVTWKNTDPKSYYQYIVGKHFIGTAHYKSGKWYWYSSVTEDLLAEYGKCDSEEFDEAIEVVAWMPLPTPYKGGDSE